jgi:hypothetical protein
MLAVLVAIAAYWYFSPYLVIHEIDAAVRARDVDGLDDHVDYPRLRDSLKSQLDARLTAKMASTDGSSRGGLAAFGLAIVTGVTDRMVDAMVQPNSVMMMLSRAKLSAPVAPGQPPATPAVPDHSNQAARWVFKRESLDRLVAFAPDDQNGALETRFGVVFERDGFANWKLVGIHLPAQN